MTLLRIMTIVGARPQFVKAAVVSRAIRENGTLSEVMVHTGQHFDPAMSEVFFRELDIPEPAYHLHVHGGPHGEMTGRMMMALEPVVANEKPDWVVVYGDTNSTLAGALIAAKLHIPIAHVEAGLRSFNRTMPEEVNRVVTDHLSDRLFCPTETACMHLESEGITQGVEVVGDVMYDMLLQVQPELEARARSLLSTYGVSPHGYLLLTVHRPANTDDSDAMGRIVQALNRLDMPVIFPLHPRTSKLIKKYDITWGNHIRFIEPVGYLDMLALEKSAHRVLTDSGGVQKEAFLLGVPCVTLREETEWIETVESGWNILAGCRTNAILEAVNRPEPDVCVINPFGKGDAALRIARGL